VGGHGDTAEGVKLKARVGVAHLEVDGRSNWSGGFGVVDDYGGNVPG
jgi:hypothetical protein